MVAQDAHPYRMRRASQERDGRRVLFDMVGTVSRLLRRWRTQDAHPCRMRKAGTPHPLFFVSAESKGLRDRVNPLFATLAGRFISVAAKGLMGAGCWRESNGLGWEDFGGVRRTSWPIEAPFAALGTLGKRAHIKGEAPSMAGAGATQEL